MTLLYKYIQIYNMSILDDENKVYKDIAEKSMIIQREQGHTADYHQAWWDVIKKALTNKKLTRNEMANILFTYKQNFWNSELYGMGGKDNPYIIIYDQDIAEDNSKMIALKAYISLLMSNKKIDKDLFDDTSKFSIFHNLFGTKFIEEDYKLFNSGEFRHDYLLNGELVSTKYQTYLNRILEQLKLKYINISL